MAPLSHNVREEFLLGTATDPDGTHKPSIRLTIRLTTWAGCTLDTAGDILSLANWMQERATAIMQFAREAHEWEKHGGFHAQDMPNPDHDPLFSSSEEEEAERKAWSWK